MVLRGRGKGRMIKIITCDNDCKHCSLGKSIRACPIDCVGTCNGDKENCSRTIVVGYGCRKRKDDADT